ncbi:MAG: LysE family translocator [Gammaproteobacteria bacterium]|nr:LysE family translocator [Gammaproteobacteria bacterium]
MFELSHYLTFILACVVIVIVPGPTVTVIIANSMRAGTGAGLLNVAGTQFGLLTMLAIVALGLEVIIAQMSILFEFVRIAGAAYLIWLGIKLLRSRGQLIDQRSLQRGSYFWQGFVVIWSNPKALLFLGAFIPQFVDPGTDTITQTLILGLTFMVVATLLDGSYAVVAGRTGRWLTRSNVRKVEWFSGTSLIVGGLWLAFGKADN